MKKTLIAISTVAILTAGYVGSAYYLGGKAEDSLQKQHDILAQTSFIKIQSRQYHRGWFASDEEMVVRIKPAALAQIQNKLPDNLKAVLSEPITLHNHISHHLFANGLLPVRAVVDSDIQYTPKVKEVLQRFFGNQTPVRLNNVIQLDGSGMMKWQVPSFQYEELSGIALDWKGLDGELDYRSAFTRYESEIKSPALTIKLADKGSIGYQDLVINGHTEEGQHGLSLGNSQLTLDKLDIEWKEGIQYDIKLNELINMMSDLQIGSFLNPYGSITPNHISLHNLKLNTQVSESGQFVDAKGNFGFERLEYGADQYGPLHVDVEASHLDALSLVALKERRNQLITQKLNDEQIRQALLDAARNEAAGLFTNDPVIQLKDFSLTTPSGKVIGSGELKFNGLTAPDLNNFNAMMAKTQAAFDISMPQALLEQMAVAQAKHYISVDANAGDAQTEIQNAVKVWLDQMFRNMAAEGYLKQENGQITTTIAINNNQLSMNGKRIELQANQDLLPDSALPSPDASVTSAP